MRPLSRVLALALTVVAAAACGTEKKAPTSPAAGGTASTGGQLPQGHPPMSQIPPGHPPLRSMGSQGEERPAPEPVSAEAPEGCPVVWTAPEGWTATVPANAMRIANFTVAEAEGAPVEVTVFSLGGTADQNIQRWIGQFDFPEGASGHDVAQVRESTVNGLKVKSLDVVGTFGGGMGDTSGHGGSSYRMLGAVIEGASAPLQVKLVGPADVVAEQVDAFGAFVRSFQPR